MGALDLKNRQLSATTHDERVLQKFGFHLARSSGSHRIFSHPEIPQLLNPQSVRGEVTPYQVRQFLRLLEWYDLRLEDRP